MLDYNDRIDHNGMIELEQVIATCFKLLRVHIYAILSLGMTEV